MPLTQAEAEGGLQAGQAQRGEVSPETNILGEPIVVDDPGDLGEGLFPSQDAGFWDAQSLQQ